MFARLLRTASATASLRLAPFSHELLIHGGGRKACLNVAATAGAMAAGVAATAAYASPAQLPGPDSSLVFDVFKDAYKGRIINTTEVSSCGDNSALFAERLGASLSKWREEGVRGIWLELPIESAALLPAALALGFEMHHAEKSHLMLTYWMPKGEANPLPPYNSHSVGVGACVVNNQGKVLAVQEKSGPAAKLGLWKMPTGLVGAGEDACEACAREVLEETGVEVDVGSLVAVREAHVKPRRKPTAATATPPPSTPAASSAQPTQAPKQQQERGQSGSPPGGSDKCTSTNSFFVFLCTVKEGSSHTDLTPQPSEIAACQWMEPDAFLASQATIMPPGTLYSELNRAAISAACRVSANAAAGTKDTAPAIGLVSRSMPMGFRPGTNRVYMIEGEKAEDLISR